MAQGSSKGGLNRGVPYKNIGMTLSECIFLFKSQYNLTISRMTVSQKIKCYFINNLRVNLKYSKRSTNIKSNRRTGGNLSKGIGKQ